MDNVFVLYDRLSDSVWYPMTDNSMDAVSGELQGKAIPLIAKPEVTTLQKWLEKYPDSKILLPKKRN